MNSIKARLLKEAEKDYKKFSAALIPNIDNVLGVRLPILRKIAKEIYENENWHEFLQCDDCEFMEEVMLQGMVIGLIKDKPENILEHVKNFVPKINNWSVCDSFCNGLKFAKKNKKLVWDIIQPYFNSDKEYDIRFSFVMLLSHFIDEEYIDRILELTNQFNDERYYARMGVAWAVSVCFVKFPEKTFTYLKHSNLDKQTHNKCIQKIRESYRVDKSAKEKLKKYLK